MKNKSLGSGEKGTKSSDTTESATSIDKDKKSACDSNNSLEAAGKALDESEATLEYTRKQIERSPSDADKCLELFKDIERSQAMAESKLRRRSSDLSAHESSPQAVEAAVSRPWPADPLKRGSEEVDDVRVAALQRLMAAAALMPPPGAADDAGGDAKLEDGVADAGLMAQGKGGADAPAKTESGAISRANREFF